MKNKLLVFMVIAVVFVSGCLHQVPESEIVGEPTPELEVPEEYSENLDDALAEIEILEELENELVESENI